MARGIEVLFAATSDCLLSYNYPTKDGRSTDSWAPGNSTLLHSFNGAQLVGAGTPPNEVTRVFHLSVDRAKDGSAYNCVSTFHLGQSPVITLTVTCEWNGYRL